MKLFPLLYCRHVIVHRKINSTLLVTNVYSEGVPKVHIYGILLQKITFAHKMFQRLLCYSFLKLFPQKDFNELLLS